MLFTFASSFSYNGIRNLILALNTDEPNEACQDVCKHWKASDVAYCMDYTVNKINSSPMIGVE